MKLDTTVSGCSQSTSQSKWSFSQWALVIKKIIGKKAIAGTIHEANGISPHVCVICVPILGARAGWKQRIHQRL